MFRSLQSTFQDLLKQNTDSEAKTIFDLAEIFMKVSGDVNAVREHLQGRRVIEWSYFEDIALSTAETSSEFRCLLTTKGRDAIEKRKGFLLSNSVGVSEEGKMDIDT